MKKREILLAILAAICISLITVTYTSLITGAVVGTIILTIVFVRAKHKFILATNMLMFLAAVLSGAINYYLFQQAEALIKDDPLDLFLKGHPHAPRFLIAYPAIYISELYQLDVHKVYLVYCVILSIYFLNCLNHALDMIDGEFAKMNHIPRFIISVMFITITSLMNGRLIPAYLGLCIIYIAQLRVYKSGKIAFSSLLMMLFGAFMATVSSGTMMVAVFQIAFVTVWILFKLRRKALLIKLGIAFSPLVPYIISYVSVMLMRNITFFGGGLTGIIHMTTHGLGRFFAMDYGFLLVVPIPIMGYVYVKLYQYFSKNVPYAMPIVIGVPLAMSCGMFGISTLTMSIPGILTLIYLLITAKQRKGRQAALDQLEREKQEQELAATPQQPMQGAKLLVR